MKMDTEILTRAIEGVVRDHVSEPFGRTDVLMAIIGVCAAELHHCGIRKVSIKNSDVSQHGAFIITCESTEVVG